MIFCISSESDLIDNALIFEIQSLKRHLIRQGISADLTIHGSSPLAKLQEGDELYLVGHGDRATATVSNLSPQEVFSYLKDHGFNPYLKRLRIHLICCHTGYKANALSSSFAEQLYDCLISVLHDIEIHHRQAEGSLPIIKAPKHIIGFNFFKPEMPLGLSPIDYQAYEAVDFEDKEDWLKAHENPLSEEDFQIVTVPNT